MRNQFTMSFIFALANLLDCAAIDVACAYNDKKANKILARFDLLDSDPRVAAKVLISCQELGSFLDFSGIC